MARKPISPAERNLTSLLDMRRSLGIQLALGSADKSGKVSALDAAIISATQVVAAERTEAGQAFLESSPGLEDRRREELERQKKEREEALAQRRASANTIGLATPAQPYFANQAREQKMSLGTYLRLNQSIISSSLRDALLKQLSKSQISPSVAFELYGYAFGFYHDQSKETLYFTPRIAPQYQIAIQPRSLVIIDTTTNPPRYYDADAKLSGQGGRGFDQIENDSMKSLLITIERQHSAQDQALLEGASPLAITDGTIPALDPRARVGDLVFTAETPSSEIVSLDSQAVNRSLKESLSMIVPSDLRDSEVSTFGKRFIFSRNRSGVCYFRPKDAGQYMISISSAGQLLIADQSGDPIKYYGIGGTLNPITSSTQKTLHDFNDIKDPKMNKVLHEINQKYFAGQNPGPMQVPGTPTAPAPAAAPARRPQSHAPYPLAQTPKPITPDSLSQKALKAIYEKIKSRKETIEEQVGSELVSIKLVKPKQGAVNGEIRFTTSSQEELCTLEITRTKAKGKEDVYSLETSPNFTGNKFDEVIKLIDSTLNLGLQAAPARGSSLRG